MEMKSLSLVQEMKKDLLFILFDIWGKIRNKDKWKGDLKKNASEIFLIYQTNQPQLNACNLSSTLGT